MPAEYFTATVEYRLIAGFPGYRVGSDGSVWSLWRRGGRGRQMGSVWQVRKGVATSEGYLKVGLSDGKKRFKAVHHLVLLAFVGPCPEGMECCHRDGNSGNNSLANLRWDTKAANEYDKVLNGTRHLVESDVREIRRRVATGEVAGHVAADFGVSRTQVDNIASRRQWKHVE